MKVNKSKTTIKLKGTFTPLGDQIIVLVPNIQTKIVLSEAQKAELTKRSYRPLEVIAAGDKTGLTQGDMVLRKENAVPTFLPEFTCGLEGFEYAVFSLHQIIAVVDNIEEIEVED